MPDGRNGRVISNGHHPQQHHLDQRSFLSAGTTPTNFSVYRTGVNLRGFHYPPNNNTSRIQRTEVFEDPDFPANDRAIYRKHRPATWPITWQRPRDICNRPRFQSDANVFSSNLEPGELGDTWLLSAINVLSRTTRLLERVVIPGQSFETGYNGYFRFRFWHFGEWVEVVVDDLLPTYAGKLLTLHSSDPNEFWPALLEKAYAKFYGCYEHLGHGFTTQALQDLTGGIVQNFHLASQDRFLTFQLLSSALPRATLISASIHSTGKKQLKLRHGLFTKLSYGVTALIKVKSRNGEVPLVRIRAAKGKADWTGSWSEKSWEWDQIKDMDRKRVKTDDEFWMSYDDFIKNFTHMDVVHIGPDDWMIEPYLHSRKPWRAVIARRRWRSGYNAGGGPDYVETVTCNPQFRVQIHHDGLPKCHVVVSVTQYYEPANSVGERKSRIPLHAIGFAVYEVPFTSARLTQVFVSQNSPLDVTNHCVARETVTFFTLRPGDYVVLPCTRVPDCETKFLLRIFTDEESSIWEVNDDNLILQNIPIENGEDNFRLLREGRAILSKFALKFPQEIDAYALQKIFRLYWKTLLSLSEKPTLELCRSLVMLRDISITGRISLSDVPGLMRTTHLWQSAYLKFDTSGNSKTTSYQFRSLLWEAGVSVSNKVLECLVIRFVKHNVISSDTFLRAMVRIHIAHERFRNLTNKYKSNPLSLEEVILMTIYS
ncbi:hypothetical protein CHUAL_001790 [Chamberlinius hualienensis]